MVLVDSMENPIWSFIFKKDKEEKDIIELLRSLPAFEGLSYNELLMVERLLHQRLYRSGETIFNEGMPGAGMYIIKEGEVLIKKKMDNLKDLELAIIPSRLFFGEMALIDEILRSATAEARVDTILFAFNKPDLETIMDRNPKLALKIVTNIARLLCQRLIKSNENIESLEKKLTHMRPD